jgi:hypothetical protein
MSELLKDTTAVLGLLTLLIIVIGTPIFLVLWPLLRRRALRLEAATYKGFVELDERVFVTQDQNGLICIKARRRSLTWASGFFMFLFGFGFIGFIANPPTNTNNFTPPLEAICLFLAALSTFVVSLSLPSITINPLEQVILINRRKTTYRVNFNEIEKVFTELLASKLANDQTLFKVRLRNGQDLHLGTITVHRKVDESRIQKFYDMLTETIKPSVVATPTSN